MDNLGSLSIDKKSVGSPYTYVDLHMQWLDRAPSVMPIEGIA